MGGVNKRKDSGQVLVVAALVIALILMSTAVYVYELSKNVVEAGSNSLNDFTFTVELGSRHIVIGSLANITTGGTNEALTMNLERWASVVGRQYQLGKCILNFTTTDMPPYSSGVWISWGSDGFGVSSSHANFTFQLLDRGLNVQSAYIINITTTLFVQGTYRRLEGNDTQVNVTCNLLNEGKPALAKNITLYYEEEDSWLVPDYYTLVDYGNGTYFMSFVASIPPAPKVVQVSVHAYDLREIYVQANATTIEI